QRPPEIGIEADRLEQRQGPYTPHQDTRRPGGRREPPLAPEPADPQAGDELELQQIAPEQVDVVEQEAGQPHQGEDGADQPYPSPMRRQQAQGEDAVEERLVDQGPARRQQGEGLALEVAVRDEEQGLYIVTEV